MFALVFTYHWVHSSGGEFPVNSSKAFLHIKYSQNLSMGTVPSLKNVVYMIYARGFGSHNGAGR